MKKGFLLSKPAPKIASTSSTTQVTPTSASKSPPTDRFHDVILDFIFGFIERNPLVFSSILPSEPEAMTEFLNNFKDQIVSWEKPARRYVHGVSPSIIQFLASLINLFLLDDEHQAIILMDFKLHREWEAYTNKQSPNMEDLGDPMHQSDASINVEVLNTNSIGSLDDEILATPPRNITPIPVTPLTKSQKRSAKKKACKERQKLQLQTPSGLDEHVVPTFSKESPEYTPSKPSGSRTVTFNQSLLSPPSTPYKQQLKRDSKPQSTPIDNGKKLKQKETDNTLKNGNVIITEYIPQDQEQAQLLDVVVYDIPAKWDNYTLLANLGRWGKVISVSTRVHKKYLSARIRLIPDHECLKCYNGGDWTVNLVGIPVRWFPASWNLSERKQREKFQAVMYNLPEDMTDASLFPNGHPHQFLLDSGIKSFILVKEVDGSRKLIGYFDTWDHISTRINNPQLWNGVRLSWCRYSTSNFKNLCRSARIGNAEKSSRTPKGSKSSFSGFNTNNRKNDQNKTPKSGRSTKKIDHSRNAQSKKPDVKHLIAGLKALLEYYV
ncbi:hypothetical protein RclHR1_16180007 [Rhizophagus clarus]|uniref:Uncharacterized protein n=1 Tax=Rhizophagus clarus TaxID=94130 RepID=A0A2Z6QXQ9_9GLOM|nr:hypothetical protein RclHR1_16180007 [Rhizophagus clarus]GES73754.1 hypothetical protein GLOIN_2v1871772 [Rhizophagus clarus]